MFSVSRKGDRYIYSRSLTGGCWGVDADCPMVDLYDTGTLSLTSRAKSNLLSSAVLRTGIILCCAREVKEQAKNHKRKPQFSQLHRMVGKGSSWVSNADRLPSKYV